MEIETAELISKIFSQVENIERIIWFGGHFIWIAIYYILIQMFRLHFLKLMLAAEAIGIINWIWLHQHFFTGTQETGNNSLGRIVLYWFITILLRFTPLLLNVTGGILGLKYLRKKWKNNCQPEVGADLT